MIILLHVPKAVSGYYVTWLARIFFLLRHMVPIRISCRIRISAKIDYVRVTGFLVDP